MGGICLIAELKLTQSGYVVHKFTRKTIIFLLFEHSRSAQDGWGQEENHGWGYGDIVFRETSKLYSTEMNNKRVQQK